VYERPYRKPLRYRGHDYRAPCCVHVTICTHHRQQLFGTISPDGLHLNDAGRFVTDIIRGLHSDTEGIAIDTSIVMPDHLHAIIVLGTNPHATGDLAIEHVVSRLKMRVMKAWPAGVRTRGWAPYEGTLWQRSYHDTLIRHDRQLEHTRAYILANPVRQVERMESITHDHSPPSP
jgi:putative transposase